MTETITLFKEDSLFKSYLTGVFSEKKRAIPVQTLNAGTTEESVTFEIKEIQEIDAPSVFYVCLEMARLQSLGLLILISSLILLFFNKEQIVWNHQLALISFIGCLFIHIGCNLLNDYIGHIKGVDRQSPSSGSRVIQKGWVTAIVVKRIGYFCLIVGGLLGVPAMLVHPAVIYVVLFGVLIAALVFLAYKMNLMLKGVGETLIFALSGPLMVNGFSLAITGRTNLEILMFSVLVGWSSTLLLHIKNLEQVVYNSKKNHKNWVGHLGFEKGRVLIYFWIIAQVCLVTLQVSFYQKFSWVLFNSVLILSLGLFLKIKQSKLAHVKDKWSGRFFGNTYLYLLYIVLLVSFRI